MYILAFYLKERTPTADINIPVAIDQKKLNDLLYLKQRVHCLLTDFNVCPSPPND